MKEAETDTLASFQDKQLFDDICLIELRAEVEPEGREEDVACLLDSSNVSKEAEELVRN